MFHKEKQFVDINSIANSFPQSALNLCKLVLLLLFLLTKVSTHLKKKGKFRIINLYRSFKFRNNMSAKLNFERQLSLIAAAACPNMLMLRDFKMAGWSIYKIVTSTTYSIYYNLEFSQIAFKTVSWKFLDVRILRTLNFF